MEIENPYRAPQAAAASVGSIGKSASPSQSSIKPRTPWLISFIASASSVYGPYLVMMLYTQIYVSCDHCKKATRDLLLCSPALLPLELTQRFLGMTRQDNWLWFSVASGLALLWVVCLALILRYSKLFGAVAAAISLGIGCFLATVLLAMIRM